ncbi:MAG: family 43 glycosylhydrolase [Lachnospiraceae bacterium]|nr:family 43 glycosylhydrolase [Lachnospiraceae bacterium]
MKHTKRNLTKKVCSFLLAFAMIVTSVTFGAPAGDAQAAGDDVIIYGGGLSTSVFCEPLAPKAVDKAAATKWIVDDRFLVGTEVLPVLDGRSLDVMYKSNVGNDLYCSSRMEGVLKVDANGAYSFKADSDDGCRVWVDNELIIDAWNVGVVSETSDNISLTKGFHALKVEHLQGEGGSSLKLSWKSSDAGVAEAVIPAANLLHPIQGTTVNATAGQDYNFYTVEAATWAATPTEVATVDNGTVTCKKAGKAEVSATVSGKTSKFTLDIESSRIKYEAENADLTEPARTATNDKASGGVKVGYIDNGDATVTYHVNVAEAGTYVVAVCADGPGADAAHLYWVNGDQDNKKRVAYVNSSGWDVWNEYKINVNLKAGENTITFTKDSNFAEMDYIAVYDKDYVLEIDDTPYIQGLTVGGTAVEGFSADKYFYEMHETNANSYPQIAVSGVKEGYEVTYRQANADLPEAVATITSKTDPMDTVSYGVNFYGDNTVASSIVNYGADPYVTFVNGYYYYIRVLNDSQILISKSEQIYRLAAVEPVVVYDSGVNASKELWAPEMHFINGKWYIYITWGAGANHRLYVLESKTSDAQGEYKEPVQVVPKARSAGYNNESDIDSTDCWGIDQTVFEVDGQLYGVWSGWSGHLDGRQSLWIAKMDTPTSFSSERHLISTPTYPWETDQSPVVNEGAQVVIGKDKNGKEVVNIVYSASGSWADTYCLGMITLKQGADPLAFESWKKAPLPIFKQNYDETFSTGHANFVKLSDKGGYLVYHATKVAGSGWAGRGVRIQQFTFNEDGTPFVGVACNYNSRINVIDGTKVEGITRYEAEDATIQSANKVSAYNASNGRKVNFAAREGSVSFESVNVPRSGNYKVYVGVAYKNSKYSEKAELDVVVNGDEDKYQTINIFPLNSGTTAAGLVADNWTGYEVEVHLNAGENIIEIQKNNTKDNLAIDYIEVENALKAYYDLNKNNPASLYTADSYKSFSSALANAKAILSKANATEAEEAAAYKTLSTAVKNLKDAEPVKPTTPPTTNPTVTPAPAKTPAPAVKAPGKPVIKSVVNKKGKKIVVTLKKKVSGAKGYTVLVATDKKFKKGLKKVNLSAKKTSVTVSKLKKGKTYYVKVCAYTKNAKGTKISGKYSAVKKIKVKK